MPLSDKREFEQTKVEAFGGDIISQFSLAQRYEDGLGVTKDEVEAVKWYRKAAEEGYAEAQFKLGVMYVNGRGVTKDEAKAVKWFRKAAEQGYAHGQNNLGVMYATGRGVTKDEAEAVKWFCKAAEQGSSLALKSIKAQAEGGFFSRGCVSAQYSLGVMYANGRGVTKDEAEAVKWYRKAAEQGYACAQANLGVMYANGRGVTKDEAEAVKWTRKAAEQGDKAAQNNLGWRYLAGQGVTKDEAEAVKWTRKAAEQGFAHGQNNLGGMYANGRGVTKDEAEAVRWYRKAAEQGYACAQANLGVMYANGRGVTKDEAEAVKWYRKAAEQGYACAQANLGVMYANGRGVTKDEAEAVKWYRKAAEQGYACAQANLGVMYANGRGVTKDEAEAVKWFRKAAEQGYADAQCNLGVMYEGGQGVTQSLPLARYWYKKAVLQEQKNAKISLKALLLIDDQAIQMTEPKIASGTFGDVFKGRYQGKSVAVKRLKTEQALTSAQRESFSDELILMAALEHPSLVTVYGYAKLPLQLVMAFCQEGSLDMFLKNITRTDLPWEIRYKMATQLAQGLAYLHDNNVVHQDIKSLNVLVDRDWNAKWADFGTAKIKETCQPTVVEKTNAHGGVVGTFAWMSPEEIKGQVKHSRKSDVYSFGVVMWELASHKIPYRQKNMLQLIDAIKDGQTNAIPEDTPKHFGDAIRHSWFAKPKDRPSARLLANYLVDKSGQTMLSEPVGKLTAGSRNFFDKICFLVAYNGDSPYSPK